MEDFAHLDSTPLHMNLHSPHTVHVRAQGRREEEIAQELKNEEHHPLLAVLLAPPSILQLWHRPLALGPCA